MGERAILQEEEEEAEEEGKGPIRDRGKMRDTAR